MYNQTFGKIKNIYIHIPFCRRKCSFCDFSIYAIGSKNRDKDFFDDYISKDYVDKLIDEINFVGQNYSKYFIESELESIYFGGGTPTLLNPNLIEKIMNCLDKNFNFSKNKTEISLESDPNTFDLKKLNYLNENLNFNRITMGVQSLDEKVFKHLNRSHSIQQTYDSIDIIKSSEFKNNFGVDLIQGLPDQNFESFKKDLDNIIKYDIPHLSVYMLSLEINSSLFKKYEKEYNSEKKQNQIADMFTYGHNILSSRGYKHYEISNFCKNRKYSIHNKSYWDGFSNFYGFGNSASSYAFGKRFKKPKSIKKYYNFVDNIKNDKNYFENFLKENNENKEFSKDEKYLDLKFLLLNHIRRIEGINLTEIKNYFGDDYYKKIKEFFINYIRNKKDLMNFSMNNNMETITVIFPQGALISDEILVNLYDHLEN